MTGAGVIQQPGVLRTRQKESHSCAYTVRCIALRYSFAPHTARAERPSFWAAAQLRPREAFWVVIGRLARGEVGSLDALGKVGAPPEV